MLRRCLALVVLSSCGSGGGFPDAGLPDATLKGTFSLTWSVVDQDNQPLACDRIATQSMTVLAHNKAFAGGETQIFTCKDGEGSSQAVIAGVYDLDFELAGTFGIVSRAASQKDVVVPSGGNVQLQPVEFQVEALGDLALSISAGPNGNCGGGGAGIDGFTITMNRTSDPACNPLTLNISAGATKPASTSTNDSTTPVVTGCIENDQVITASDVDSDAYTLHVKGKIGTTDCFSNNDTIQVPPLQLVLTRTLNLVKATGGVCGP